MNTEARPKLRSSDAGVECEAPGQWRNWYLSIVDHETTTGWKRAGEEWPGASVFASQEEAEGAALAHMEIRAMARELNGDVEAGDPTIYLGARGTAP